MVRIAILRPGAPTLRATLDNGVYLVGSGPDCPIRVEAAGVSRRHAQFVVRDRRVTVMDLGSSNGTFCGEEQFFAQEPHTLTENAVLRLGAAEIQLAFPAAAPEPAPAEGPASAEDASGKEPVEVLPISGVPASARPMLQAIKKQVHRELLNRLNLKKLVVSGVSQSEMQKRAL